MDLTTEAFQKFVGGDIEIQNKKENYLYRGPIKAITIVEDDLVVVTTWLAQMIKDEAEAKALGQRWKLVVGHEPYRTPLQICTVSDVGEGRLCLISPVIGELTMLYPAGGSQLSQSRVSGFEPV